MGTTEPDLIADLRHMTAAWDAPRSRVVVGAAIRAPFYPALMAVMLVRASMWAYRHRLAPIAHLFKSCAVAVAGVEIHPGARIGPGLALVHSVGIVVGREVVAGSNLVLHHGVTLGDSWSRSGQPRLGDRVRIGAGAKVLGPIMIGDDVRVGANAVVVADVPAGATVVGAFRDGVS